MDTNDPNSVTFVQYTCAMYQQVQHGVTGTILGNRTAPKIRAECFLERMCFWKKAPIFHISCQHFPFLLFVSRNFVQAPVDMMIGLAIEMNNLGVNFLCAGKDQEALEQFQGALQLVMYKSQGHQYSPPDERVNRAHMSLMRYHRESPSCDVVVCQRRPGDETVFSRALRIDEQPPYFLLETSSSRDFHHLMSATILFNTAVTLHLQPGDKGIPRAESLYRISYDLLTRTQPSLIQQSFSELLLPTRLVLALLNNLTHINYNLGKYDLAKSLSNALSAFISSIPRATSSTLWDEKKRALLNSFFMFDPPSAAGAA